MDWIKVSIYTTSAGIEPVSGRLYQLGITGIEIEDEQDFKDFLENNHQYWDYVDDDLIKQKQGETRVIAYVSDNAAGREMLSEIRSSLLEMSELNENGEFGRLEIELDNTSEEDWANNWKKYFHALEIGKKLIIKPEWEDLEEPAGKVVFSINPGMSFGTGSHYTTQLCIEAIEEYIKPDDMMLDLGCGSGILSVIALMLGAKEAYAVDIDPNAVTVAYENADRNNVSRSRYHVMSGNILTDENLQNTLGEHKYDIIAANIVADVIIGLAPKAKEYLKDGGVFITSGIIEDREDDVRSALEECGFKMEDIRRRKDWLSIICR